MFDVASAAIATQIPSVSPALKAVQPTRNMREIRSANLRALVEIHGGQRALAKKLGLKTGAYISQLLSDPPVRTISEKTTRKFEIKLGLPEGWLSTSAHTSLGDPINGSLLEGLVHVVLVTLEEVNVAVPLPQVASFLVRLNSRVGELVEVTR